MRTDYQNINGFESLTIIFITVGLVLTGAIIFTGLTPKQQTGFVAALDILDARRQAVQTVAEMSLVYGGQQEFFNQFYLAFTQVAIVPPENFEASKKVFRTAAKSVEQIPKAFILNIRQITNAPTSRPPRLAKHGGEQIAGASINRGVLTNIIPLDVAAAGDSGPASPGLGGPPGIFGSALKQKLIKFYISQWKK